MIKANFSIASLIKCYTVNIGFFLVILSLKAFAQPPQALAYSYIDNYSSQAVDQMLQYKVPASVTLAQAIFESSCGNSALAKRSNNHFGIKCHAQWGGDTIRKSDDDYDECFRKYNSIEESYKDHSLFLRTRSRYNELFKLKINDYRGWCHGLKKTGYATYAYYPEVLIKIIEEYRLYEFDRSEILPASEFIVITKAEIIKSKLTATYFTTEEFCVSDLLWTDERDFLIQSLDLIVERPEIQNPFQLNSGTLFCTKQIEIIESKLTPNGFTLKELCENDLLWTDERHFLIQSLEMVIEDPDKTTDFIVEK